MPPAQRGAILVQFALLAFVLISILGTVQIGYMYYAKRDLQRVADIAAIEAVNALTYGLPSTCSSGQTAGQLSVTQQLRVGLEATDNHFDCGHWDASKTDAQRFNSNYGTRVANPLNAVQVTLRGQTLQLLPFTGNREIEAHAIAAKNGEPVAAFSVGAQLLRFNPDAPLGSILGLVGLNVDDLRLLDSDGLASAKITPAGLLNLLGVDLGISDLGLLTPDGVANIRNISLLNIIDASISAVTDSTLAVSLNAMRARLVNLGLGHVEIPLGSNTNSGGLFAFLATGRDDPLGNAMDVEIGLGELLKTAIAIGSGRNALSVPGLDVGGLIKAKASIVEPPTIAVGPVGTTAYSAQIRVLLDIDTRSLLGGVVNFLIEGLLGTRVYLPIALDVTTAQAELEAIQCKAMPPTIDLSIDSRILNACVGDIPASSAMSERHGCEVGLGQVQLIKLFHAPVLAGKLHVPGLQYTDMDSGLEMKVGDIRSSRANKIQLGNTTENLVIELLNLLSGLFRKPEPTPNFEGSFDNSVVIDQLIETYLSMPELSSIVKTNAGFYNVAGITNLMLNGATIVSAGETIRIDPLVSNFSFEHAIPTTCVLFVCPPNLWTQGTFSEAFNAYSNTPYSLLDVVGIPTLGNNFQSCAGLLSSLINRNNCIKHNLKELLRQHKNQVGMDSSTLNNIVNQIMNPKTDTVQCNGALCMLLKPVLSLLKPILNGVGQLVSLTLEHVLGIELGRSDVEALGIQCDVAEIVY
ncbi:hypothetical protein E8K88_06185 [Lampropedia aestuarii]|uniref:Uncharacterized protein n=1 Tax=Lampropedia aestuarii TaxID=2562762 RepID=A0A4V3YXC0_9BURK|nr:TadG family pilus assembly protein [Lampropedia aestuarii]THJ34652.1 hypothetical protein E8K88_06185 [Lampropedia aestuarii]